MIFLTEAISEDTSCGLDLPWDADQFFYRIQSQRDGDLDEKQWSSKIYYDFSEKCSDYARQWTHVSIGVKYGILRLFFILENILRFLWSVPFQGWKMPILSKLSSKLLKRKSFQPWSAVFGPIDLEYAEDGAIQSSQITSMTILLIAPLKGRVVLGFDPASNRSQAGQLLMTGKTCWLTGSGTKT